MEKLQFRLRDIPDSGLDLQVALPVEMIVAALEGAEGVDPTASTARLTAQVSKVRDNVFVHGELGGVATMACVRCLEPAHVNLTTPLNLTFMPEAVGAPDPDADELATSDAEFATYQGDQIDLTELVREQIVLAVPIAPLCREECRGLCPVCGKNRNTTPCECRPAAADEHPFAALQGLKIP